MRDDRAAAAFTDDSDARQHTAAAAAAARGRLTRTDERGAPMNLFRNLLFWIVLALVGALVAQLLVQDPGYVLVRYGGNDYTTNVPKAIALLLLVAAGLWLLWKLLSLPLAALRRHRKPAGARAPDRRTRSPRPGPLEPRRETARTGRGTDRRRRPGPRRCRPRRRCARRRSGRATPARSPGWRPRHGARAGRSRTRAGPRPRRRCTDRTRCSAPPHRCRRGA